MVACGRQRMGPSPRAGPRHKRTRAAASCGSTQRAASRTENSLARPARGERRRCLRQVRRRGGDGVIPLTRGNNRATVQGRLAFRQHWPKLDAKFCCCHHSSRAYFSLFFFSPWASRTESRL
ncbi:hypothetical protein pneo_cds_883 [Pandoravirus neocaledonia]|uniref:Uncharacterized protein n=1 Tax=Pandoravirus neocaledonia TaxID=2107708 RepID=A0A2U7UDT5_9VIRU|nr:hypothetical protein pneo_cds_883 [Pandoravirus neocaledonia]AVK76490.1 hypothetical protein pneo_cds_883 [Pandoravirus neocaledonia]